VSLRFLKPALVAIFVTARLVTCSAAQDGPAAESLAKNLQAHEVKVRRDAARQIREADRPVQRHALPVMIQLLKKETDGQVRLAVLDALTALGPDAASAVPALVDAIRNGVRGEAQEKRHQDFRAALALAAVGIPAVEGLRGLLKEPKESLRAEAIMALGRIGSPAATAVPDLMILLGNPSERIGAESSLALGRIGTSAIEPLIRATSQNDAIARARAVTALGHLAAPTVQVRSTVIKCTCDTAPEVRAAALKSLARFEVSEETLPAILEKNLRDEDERVRLAAVNLLARRRGFLMRSAPELESLLEAKHDGTARCAAFLLSQIGAVAAPHLLGALRHDKSRIAQIAEALAQLGPPIAPVLSGALHSPEPRVRQGAALALGQLRPVPASAAQQLASGLSDPDRSVKAAFLVAIGYLGPRAAESVPAVRSVLKDDSADVRKKAIEILARAAPRDKRLVDDLKALLSDADPRVEHQAIDAIASLGPLGRTALPEVIEKLGSTDAEVRLAAVDLVGSYGEAAAAAVPALTALLDDPAPRQRTITAQSLGKLGKSAQPALDLLGSLLGAEQVEVREAAASALGSLELDAGVLRPHLAKALRDERPQVRRAAMRAIQRLGPQGAIFVPDIIALAEKKENRTSVERMLRRFEAAGPDARSVPELVSQLAHKADGVRLLAIKFLALAGPRAREAIPALERLQKDSSAEIRKQAQAASERIKQEPRSAARQKRA
jgi:HEAT repeat protein